MRRLFPLLLLLTACRPSSPEVTTGVSQQLAQLRQRTLHDVHYDLSFCLSADVQQPIQAQQSISFELDSLWSVQLDFREADSLLHSLEINGQPVPIRFEQEHLILPQSLLHLGHNQVNIGFTAGNQSLNRRDDYLYTLFVPDRARTVFPCFDQPDLKARFTLTLGLPEGWTAVSNTYAAQRDSAQICFAETEPLSTYLFAFAAGRFDYQSYHDPKSGRTIGAYYRETDPQRLAQLPDIFAEVCFSLDWQEQFTAQPYPFAKYDLVILPGFQFGGMEHTGATFYNDNTLFLSAQPTLEERLSRSNLIAHETTHMWFGDYVTMRWFDDVWTKEVFANYFAAAITEPLYPDIDHRLHWLRTFQASALSEDRTMGGTSIQQQLDNLQNAGLVYNQIIYNKAPLVMRKMVALIGEEAFRRGIRRYVSTFAFGNATWDDLVAILDAETPVDLRQFSRVWVKERGLPHYLVTDSIAEFDPYGRGLHWPQSWRDSTLVVDDEPLLLPNIDGQGYGLFLYADSTQLQRLTRCWQQQQGIGRMSLLMTLHENYLASRLTDLQWTDLLLTALPTEADPLIAGLLVSYLSEPLLCTPQPAAEAELLRLAQNHPLTAIRTQLWRLLASRLTGQSTLDALYQQWERGDNPLLSVNDWMTISYELAVRMPHAAQRILSTQRQRLTNPDRLRQFDYISRAVVPSEASRDSLFQALVTSPQERRIEPWARTALYYLNHPLRQADAVRYIRPALEALPDIQRTGDIFFPGQWCSNLLAAHRTPAAAHEVQSFLDAHPDLQPMLRNKILVAAFGAIRQL